MDALYTFTKGAGVGGHFCFSPDQAAFTELQNHVTIWVFPLKSGQPQPIFRFPEADARIDYPVWSPSGRWVLFDRMISQGGDIYLVEDLE